MRGLMNDHIGDTRIPDRRRVRQVTPHDVRVRRIASADGAVSDRMDAGTIRLAAFDSAVGVAADYHVIDLPKNAFAKLILNANVSDRSVMELSSAFPGEVFDVLLRRPGYLALASRRQIARLGGQS